MNWFARVVAHHPYVILVAVAVLASTCIIIPFTAERLPSFADPQLGFEARGTTIAQRIIAWNNLKKASEPSGVLTSNPVDLVQYPRPAYQTPIRIPPLLSTPKPNEILSKGRKKGKKKHDILDEFNVVEGEQHNESDPNSSTRPETRWNDFKTDPHIGHHHTTDGFFCNVPRKSYSRVVLSSIDGSDLFNLRSLLSMCHVEMSLSNGAEFPDLCERINNEECCHGWSLPNYVAQISKKASCFEITAKDVALTKQLLRDCAHYYHTYMLSADCHEDPESCENVPKPCQENNAVYNLIYYIIAADYLTESDNSYNNTSKGSPNATLRDTMLVLPIAQGTAILNYYHSLEGKKLLHGNVKVTAMEFGLKSTLFDESLVHDTWMIGAGGIFVLLCMWAYTGSFFITVMTLIAIVFSLGISYFMYSLVFELNFFPFMNLLASIVVVGIGADDAFIFCKVWQCAKSEKNNGTLVKLVNDTLRHASVSMLVTSITTAAAFYASYISNITAIRCFSIFAGTATLANFVLMVTWLPASVVVSERWCCPPLFPNWLRLDIRLRYIRTVAVRIRESLDRALIYMVTNLHYLWLAILGGAAIASIVIVFYYPRLKLPDSRTVQLFRSSHLFERYDLLYKDRFWFEREYKDDDSNDIINMKLPLRFVWGVLPIDNGNYLNPASLGTLVYDPTFDVAAPESQEWLFHFCQQIRNQPFYQSTFGPLLPHCFLETFIKWMKQKCKDTLNNMDRTPCCQDTKFPYPRDVFDICIMKSMATLYQTPATYLLPGMAGPKFDKKTFKIRAIVVEYDSNYSYSFSYKEMDHFYKQVEKWTREQLGEAPPGMENGWFVSHLDFYDLQRTLSADTLATIGVSMPIALAVLLLFTLNIFVSLYAILTITCIIFVTVAILVLLGWKLNVLESVAVCTTIGLAVDFSLHYGVHYRLCPDGTDRQSAVKYALSRMGGPTIMAALTTAAAGAFVLPSNVLAYIQIGVFLVVVMFVSWVYSTFFLGSLLCVAGPQHGFGQFRYPSLIRKWCRGESGSICGTSSGGRISSGGGSRGGDKSSVYAIVLSESSMSASSTACPLHQTINESHELESRRYSFGRRLRRSESAGTPAAVPLVPRQSKRKVSLPTEQSPSATSATTIVLIDDADLDDVQAFRQ